MIKTNFLILTLLLTFPLYSYAQAELESAVAELNKGEYETALKKMLPLANAGNAKAQNMIGFMYYRGLGVDQSYIEAIKWYRKASDLGFADAQTNLGLMYQVGQGVEQRVGRELSRELDRIESWAENWTENWTKLGRLLNRELEGGMADRDLDRALNG